MYLTAMSTRYTYLFNNKNKNIIFSLGKIEKNMCAPYVLNWCKAGSTA